VALAEHESVALWCAGDVGSRSSAPQKAVTRTVGDRQVAADVPSCEVSIIEMMLRRICCA
jgi:hypothetical protein